MHLKNIKLKNYRNYELLDLNFDKNINIIYGDNAAGKTNILESIYMCSYFHSHKNNKDNELIKFNNEEAHIKANFIKEKKEKIIDIHIKQKEKKGIALNENKIEKITDVLGFINIIMFSPEDLNIIKEGPNIRRKYLDLLIYKTDKNYIKYIVNYNKVLNQRNKLLKTINLKNDNEKKQLLESIEIWDEKLFEYGKVLIKKREEKINEIKNILKEKHLKITENKEILNIDYEKNIKIENFLEELKNNREKDLNYLYTNVGPHRDDIKINIGSIDLRKFGSVGQKKTAVLSLKLTELELIKINKNENPILLLDDVFSELDEKRQKMIIDEIKNLQTIITCTGIKKNIYEILNPNKIIYIKNGKVGENFEKLRR